MAEYQLKYRSSVILVKMELSTVNSGLKRARLWAISFNDLAGIRHLGTIETPRRTHVYFQHLACISYHGKCSNLPEIPSPVFQD